jgi:rod shape determining protein RodA
MLFFLFLFRGLRIAADARCPEGTYLAAGIVLIFATHVGVNVGICLGVMPVTGLPLSFISYGGSSLLVNCMSVSLLLNVRLRRFG